MPEIDKSEVWHCECRMESIGEEKWKVYKSNHAFHVANGQEAGKLRIWLNTADAAKAQEAKLTAIVKELREALELFRYARKDVESVPNIEIEQALLRAEQIEG